ncbi:MAG: hypothetical protein QF819_05860 [Gemmatimonadota bacterium]|jgi:hypothetical protein|nr:hypothetical protein [Gemmatimonadota bacterium]MDP6802688.1 hypothetical protein [Gemmatimonadota bacterium]MDP7031687.1 hypothetical protein [Gemmatimonadota bacterium]
MMFPQDRRPPPPRPPRPGHLFRPGPGPDGPTTLDRLCRVRRRALRDLGVRPPKRPPGGDPRALILHAATLDRWIARNLDLAGGRRIPPWEDTGEPWIEEEAAENEEEGEEDCPWEW